MGTVHEDRLVEFRGHRLALVCLAILCMDAALRGPFGVLDNPPELLATAYGLILITTLMVLGATLEYRLWLLAFTAPTLIALIWAAVDSAPALLTTGTGEAAGSLLLQTTMVFLLFLLLGAAVRGLALLVRLGVSQVRQLGHG